MEISKIGEGLKRAVGVSGLAYLFYHKEISKEKNSAGACRSWIVKRSNQVKSSITH
ncbi:MAG: hypothetical protein ABIU77_06870 [Ferruginibacter sp.]